MSIAIKYILFSIVSVLVNLIFQYISFLFYSGYLSIYLAMFIGTLSALILKYILDKKYIFYHTPKNKKDDTKKFLLYSFMGLFTTAIFWGFEIWFDHYYQTQNAKYIGAILGLTIGYIIKYFLDKAFVFKDQNESK